VIPGSQENNVSQEQQPAGNDENQRGYVYDNTERNLLLEGEDSNPEAAARRASAAELTCVSAASTWSVVPGQT
jgi:hypothetical protein